MNNKSPVPEQEWHIPRPSLAGSSVADTRSRGGSASSQGSGSSSNHSTHSVSSGSLLLSAAHLARMGGRHPQEERPHPPKLGHSLGRKLSESFVAIPEESRDPTDSFWNGVKRGSAAAPDTQSVASSTHFTVVNGFTKHRTSKEPRVCCCNHSHQITVLVISMTILFSACILAAICFVEMRMRKETGIYKYS